MRYYTTTYYECLGTHFQAVSKQDRFEFSELLSILDPADAAAAAINEASRSPPFSKS